MVCLPYSSRCATDFLALYQGSSPTDPLLAKVCEPRPTFLEFAGPNLLLEFRSVQLPINLLVLEFGGNIFMEEFLTI